MSGGKKFRVKQLAELANVTVRALHHYDEIGLLVPSERTAAGYRLYGESDALRLQEILIGRELGLSLEDIAALLDNPSTDRLELLGRQREQLLLRRATTDKMIRAVELAIAKLEGDVLTSSEFAALFDGFNPTDYEEEAQKRWGETEAYRESARRTKDYSKADWLLIKQERSELMQRLAVAMTSGTEPQSTDAMDLADQYRQHIDRWFYPCSREMHCQLARLYVSDERFAKSFDQHGEGLAAFVSNAILANGLRT